MVKLHRKWLKIADCKMATKTFLLFCVQTNLINTYIGKLKIRKTCLEYEGMHATFYQYMSPKIG